jgi:hypothetical protein
MVGDEEKGPFDCYLSQKLPSPLADRFAEVRELTAFAALQIPCARLA